MITVFSVYGEVIEKTPAQLVIWPAQGNFVADGSCTPADTYLVIEPEQGSLDLAIFGTCIVNVHRRDDGSMQAVDFTWSPDPEPYKGWQKSTTAILRARFEPVRRPTVWDRLLGE